MVTYPIDTSADTCPCCSAPRRGDDAEWPWTCACFNCPVAAMGRTCGGKGDCWQDCPYMDPAQVAAGTAACPKCPDGVGLNQVPSSGISAV